VIGCSCDGARLRGSTAGLSHYHQLVSPSVSHTGACVVICLHSRVDLLEREQGVYQGQIQQLQADNKELAQLQQMMASNNMNMNKRSSASKAGKGWLTSV